MNLTEHLHELTTVALLGTDRRDPPSLPTDDAAAVGLLLADLVADAQRTTPSQRLLVQVAACTVALRAGVVPQPPVPLAAPAPHDERPITPPAATDTWRRIVADWAVLEDEWLLTVVARGRRLAPELVPPVLARHRGDRVRHCRALLAAGSLGEWMIEWSPKLACSARATSGTDIDAVIAAAVVLPELAVIPEIAALFTGADAQSAPMAAALTRNLSTGAWSAAHRAVLINALARVRPELLPDLAAALDAVDPSSPSIGLAFALADLTRLRQHMLTELEPA